MTPGDGHVAIGESKSQGRPQPTQKRTRMGDVILSEAGTKILKPPLFSLKHRQRVEGLYLAENCDDRESTGFHKGTKLPLREIGAVMRVGIGCKTRWHRSDQDAARPQELPEAEKKAMRVGDVLDGFQGHDGVEALWIVVGHGIGDDEAYSLPDITLLSISDTLCGTVNSDDLARLRHLVAQDLGAISNATSDVEDSARKTMSSSKLVSLDVQRKRGVSSRLVVFKLIRDESFETVGYGFHDR